MDVAAGLIVHFIGLQFHGRTNPSSLSLLLASSHLRARAKKREKVEEGNRLPTKEGNSNWQPVRRTHRQKESLKEMSGESKGVIG